MSSVCVNTADNGTATQLPRIYKALETFGFETGAFSQLTRQYMREEFNPKTPDADGVKYVHAPAFFMPFVSDLQVLLLRRFS